MCNDMGHLVSSLSLYIITLQKIISNDPDVMKTGRSDQ